MKNIIIEFIKGMLHLLFVFPIKHNRLMFSAYSGRQYSCNPKYISEWIETKYGNDFEIVWAVNDESIVPNSGKTLHTVRYKSLKYLYLILTSKVIIDNVESWSILPKRKGQLVINTWHGGGAYKGVGLKRKDASDAVHRNMLKKNERITLYISSSKAFSEMTLRDSFHYKGKILESGMPRNDLLIADNDFQKDGIREKLGIRRDTRIVLYAPTFRNDSSFCYTIDAKLVLDALRKRFGNDWVLLVRTHYYINDESGNSPDVLNVSDYPDMQELLLIADVLLTDYSSSIWDFSLMYKPAFLYMPDYDHYVKERAFYTPVNEWPYPSSTTMEGLINTIINYDSAASKKRIVDHHKRLGSYEKGTATEIVGKLIVEYCGN